MEAFNMTSNVPAQALSHRFEDLVLGLLAENNLPEEYANTVITGIATDSRKVIPGDLFIALNGLTVDGRDYINDAVERGAIAVLADADESFSIRNKGLVAIISMQNLGEHLSEIAGRFYGSQPKTLRLLVLLVPMAKPAAVI